MKRSTKWLCVTLAGAALALAAGQTSAWWGNGWGGPWGGSPWWGGYPYYGYGPYGYGSPYGWGSPYGYGYPYGVGVPAWSYPYAIAPVAPSAPESDK